MSEAVRPSFTPRWFDVGALTSPCGGGCGCVSGCASPKKKTRKFGIKILARRARTSIPNFRRHIFRLIAHYGIKTRI